MIHIVYFSATGTTERITNAIADCLGGEYRSYNMTIAPHKEIRIESPEDTVLIGTPVYAGRVPKIAAEGLQRLHGCGQKAIAVCVYGNRDYDDALVELCDIVEACGFTTVAAGAFIARHCIFPKVADNRPDNPDMEKIGEFAALCAERIAGRSLFDPKSVKGNRPYLTPAGVPIHPKSSKTSCRLCGKCASNCPTGAIDTEKPYLTDNSKCISCCRCISICPYEVRAFGGLLYKIAGWKFTKDYLRRKEPEWF